MGRVLRLAAAALLAATGSWILGAERLDAGGASVSIVDFAFQPGGVEVLAGGTVSWSNNGETEHTVTANGGSFDSGTLAPGGGFSTDFSTPGTFSYFCTLHAQMRGTVTVTSPTPAPLPAPDTPTTGSEPNGRETPTSDSGSSDPVVVPPTTTG
jgi:plastocyanin